jgi:hypothetical protein
METPLNAPIDKQALILALIKDDLINTKLVNALIAIGIDASNYNLHLCETIFELMELEESIENDPIVEHYLDLTSLSRNIDFVKEPKSLNKLAEKIYRYLNSVCPKPIIESKSE